MASGIAEASNGNAAAGYDENEVLAGDIIVKNIDAEVRAGLRIMDDEFLTEWNQGGPATAAAVAATTENRPAGRRKRKTKTDEKAQQEANESPWMGNRVTFGDMPPRREDVMLGDIVNGCVTYTHLCYCCETRFRCVPNIPRVFGVTVLDPLVHNCRCLKHHNYRMDMTFCSHECFWEWFTPVLKHSPLTSCSIQ